MIRAKQHLRPMRGGAQSHLMYADDGNYHVVKFQNNPQHIRVLANEMLATRLADRLGLPVPPVEIIEVSPWIIENTPELVMRGIHAAEPCTPGLCLALRFVLRPFEGTIYDYIPGTLMGKVRNLADFHGMLCLDKWTCNTNGRQVVYWRRKREKLYTATFIDQGYCFNAGEWVYADGPLRGVFPRNEVYAGVCGWESFEPWLSRIESFDPQKIWEIAEGVPPEWYGGSSDELERLLDELVARRAKVRELIEAFRNSPRRPFPSWNRVAAAI